MSSTIRSLQEMYSEVQDESHTAGDAAMQTRIIRWLNYALQYLCAKFDFHSLNSRISFAITSAAQANLDWPHLIVAAPMDAVKINFAELEDEAETPDRYTPLTVLSHNEFMRLTQGDERSTTDNQNTPTHIALRRIEGVREDVANDTLISVEVISSSASDTGAGFEVAMLSYRSADRRDQQKVEVQLAGQAAVVYAGTHIPSVFSKGRNTTGVITLRQQTTNVVLATIMPWDRSSSYHVFEMTPFPDANYNVWMEYKRRPPLMTLDRDVPYFLPPEAHDYLVEAAKVKALRFTENTDWQNAERERIRILGEIENIVTFDTLEDRMTYLG